MSITEEIRKALFDNQDTGYRDFHAKLMPTVDKETVIGVRTPVLRALAKEFAKREDVGEFLRELPHKYYEENNMHGMIIEAYKDFDEFSEAIEVFLPYVDNWATCDLLKPKSYKKNRQKLIPYIEKWLQSDQVYTRRFAIGMLLAHFLEEDFDEKYLQRVAAIRSDEYYINMMIAWYFAEALVKQYDTAVKYLQTQTMDRWTHNKAIQKAIESFRITTEQKTYLRTLRI